MRTIWEAQIRSGRGWVGMRSWYYECPKVAYPSHAHCLWERFKRLWQLKEYNTFEKGKQKGWTSYNNLESIRRRRLSFPLGMLLSSQLVKRTILPLSWSEVWFFPLHIFASYLFLLETEWWSNDAGEQNGKLLVTYQICILWGFPCFVWKCIFPPNMLMVGYWLL